MIPVLKYDTSTYEDIADLYAFMLNDFSKLKYIFERILITNTVPNITDIGGLDDLTLHTIVFDNGINLQICPPFFIITNANTLTTNILEFDKEDVMLYAYNLETTDEKTKQLISEILIMVESVFELNEDLRLSEIFNARTTLDEIIYVILSEFPQFKKLKKADISDALNWLGCNETKRVLN